MSLVARIYLGMVAMIALILLVGGFSAIQTSGLAGTFVEYRATAKTSLLAGEMAQGISEVRLASLKYRQARDPQELEKITDNVAKVSAITPEFIEALEGYDEQPSLNAVPGMLSEYAGLMAQVSQLQMRLDELVAVTSTAGRSARQQLTEQMEAALSKNDTRLSAAAGAVKSELLLGRLYLERYLISKDPAAFQRSSNEIESARLALSQFLNGAQGRDVRASAEATLEDLRKFKTAASEIFEVVKKREALFARLDKIGPETLAIVDRAVAAVVNRQNTLGPAGAAAAQSSIVIVAALVAIGTVVGLLFAFLTGRTISRRLVKVTDDMTKLAEGNLDIEIDATDDKHEIGKMTNAMAVFLENARTARDLYAEVKDTERKELERIEEEHAREARLEKERLRQEEERNSDRSRMATLENFQKDMERVMDEAASGNFSVRMSEKVEDKNLTNLASVVNRLLQATETNITDIVTSIGELAKGNLGVRIEGERQGAFLAMKDDFNASLASLSETMAKILESGQSVSKTSLDLKNSSKNMSRRAEDNAATVEETSAAVEEITASIRQVVANAKAADEATQRVRQSADETRKVSTETEASINAMTDASAQINGVVKVIEDIAFHINLLALNAGVEAARAGEAVLGFSVVASEVRALALRSQEAVQEITKVIEQSNLSVEAGVEQVGLSRKALEGIIVEVEVASEQISEIALAVEEQAKGIEEVNTAVRAIDVNAQKNAATLEEMTASSESMSDEADQLSAALGEFQGIDRQHVTAEKPKTAALQNKEAVQPVPRTAAMSGSVGFNDDGWDEF